MATEPASLIVDASGQPVPVRREKKPDKRCPQCLAGPDKRVASGGFGSPHPVCGRCGFEWHDEVWRG